MNKTSLWRIYRAHLFIKSIYIYRTLHVKNKPETSETTFSFLQKSFFRQRFSATYNTENFRVFTLWIPPQHKEKTNKQTTKPLLATHRQ